MFFGFAFGRMKFPKLSLLLSVCVAAIVPSEAAIVLQIDITNPNAVVFRSTTANAQSNGSADADYEGGITIENFFISARNITTAVALSGNLTSSGATASFNELVTFNFGNSTPVSADDLSVYHAPLNTGGVQTFSTSLQAFTGSGSVDLSTHASALWAVGQTGDVLLSYQNVGGQRVVIGQWEIVSSIPEPSAYAAIFGGMALGCAIFSRRRRVR
jgi:hypothetical protein